MNEAQFGCSSLIMDRPGRLDLSGRARSRYVAQIEHMVFHSRSSSRIETQLSGRRAR